MVEYERSTSDCVSLVNPDVRDVTPVADPRLVQRGARSYIYIIMLRLSNPWETTIRSGRATAKQPPKKIGRVFRRGMQEAL